jgi:hypothetical protein
MVTLPSSIVYPESDGLPMADNTRQFESIVYVKKGIDWLFSEHPTVFVAGDLLWYPVEGNAKLRQPPDVMDDPRAIAAVISNGAKAIFLHKSSSRFSLLEILFLR